MNLQSKVPDAATVTDFESGRSALTSRLFDCLIDAAVKAKQDHRHAHPDARYEQVEANLETMQELAHHFRELFDCLATGADSCHDNEDLKLQELVGCLTEMQQDMQVVAMRLQETVA